MATGKKEPLINADKTTCPQITQMKRGCKKRAGNHEKNERYEKIASSISHSQASHSCLSWFLFLYPRFIRVNPRANLPYFLFDIIGGLFFVDLFGVEDLLADDF